MLRTIHYRVYGCFLVICMVGCNGSGSEENPPASETEHAHPVGSHGGTVVAVGRGHFHIEAVFSGGGVIELFLLGPDETRIIEVPTQSLAVYVKAADRLQADALTLDAAPQPGDAEGFTSRFQGKFPEYCAGREVLVTVPRLTINNERFRFSVTRSTTTHTEMPTKVADAEERQLYLTPGGKYTTADIKANGRQTASERFRKFSAAHDHKPQPGDRLCPITLTKANPQCTWVIGGERYEFCCPPCIDEFVKLAKENPDQIKPAAEYIKK
jgi:hypothetical protein